jgi:methylated-DNA-[protein]-cysteine S-methyltransferase
MNYDLMETEKGTLVIAADDAGICHIGFQADFQDAKYPMAIPEDWHRDGGGVIGEAKSQLAAYFNGERKDFDLPLNPHGTAFQKQVWAQLCCIPFGKTISYVDLAVAIGKPTASRAVGAANGRNPISIVVPCHRVIGKSGKLTGYAGGLDVKAWLLDHERAVNGELLFAVK